MERATDRCSLQAVCSHHATWPVDLHLYTLHSDMMLGVHLLQTEMDWTTDS
jgi:hypothetical protein